MPVMLKARIKCDDDDCLEEAQFHLELAHPGEGHTLEEQVPEGWSVERGDRFSKTFCSKHAAQRSGGSADPDKVER